VSESDRPGDAERRLQNLRTIAQHHAHRADRQAPSAQKPRSDGSSRWKRRLAALGPLGVALVFVLGKAKLLLPLLKVTKLGTLLTMLVAVWAYALLWGFPFALGFVLLIFVHELGHALVMQQQGIRAGAPVFIPFVGAVIAMRSIPRNAYVEALVGIGGPILGSVGALVCLVVAWVSGSLLWYALASTGFLINLFNLIPISPLDGGRIVGVISRWLWVLGYAVGIVVFLLTYSPILFLILLLGLFGLGRTLRGPRRGYFEIEPRKRLFMGAAYFGLVALLALGMYVADRPLEHIRAPAPAGTAHSPDQFSIIMI
jgi:Zn-dependent protease